MARKVEAPKQVKVGGVYVPVNFRGDLDCAGHFKSKPKLEIVLSDDLGGAVLADAFHHEVMHALWYFFAIWNDQDTVSEATKVQEISEEQVVSRLSFSLTTFWADNPEALAWYTSLIQSKTK